MVGTRQSTGTYRSSWFERPRDLRQVPLDARLSPPPPRVKQQGGIVWMALAIMSTPRWWLGGEVSEQRDMPLIRRRMERVRRGAAPRPLWVWPDGVVAYIRAIRAPFRAPVHTGQGGRATASSVAQCLDRASGQALRAAACGRDRPPPCRWHAGTGGDASTPGARRRGEQYGLPRAPACDVPGTPCAAGAPLPGAGTPHPAPA